MGKNYRNCTNGSIQILLPTRLQEDPLKRKESITNSNLLENTV